MGGCQGRRIRKLHFLYDVLPHIRILTIHLRYDKEQTELILTTENFQDVLPQTHSLTVGKGVEEGPRRTEAWSSDKKKKY